MSSNDHERFVIGRSSLLMMECCHPPLVHRSGKSSIQRVVFHKMSPTETLFLESTSKINKDNIQYVVMTFLSLVVEANVRL